MQRADGGVVSGLLLFTSTPQSIRLAAYCQLPGRGAFWSVQVRHNKPALKGDSSRARPVGDAARGESGGIGSIASSSEARRPYSNQRCGCECNEQTEGLNRGCSCLRQPLSQSASRRIASSPAGEPFGCDTICQDIRVNAQVGTRSPYSLPFVILPVPARSPFRLLVHRTRSTPNPIDKPPFSGL